MKTVFFCLSLGFLLAFSSCTTTEEIWINQDGSLRREWKMDIGALIPFVKMAEESKNNEGAESDSLENLAAEPMEDEPAEEAKDPMDNMFSEMLKRDNVDTLIAFRSIFEASMKEKGMTEEEVLRALSEADEGELSSEEKEAMGGMLKTLVNTQIRIKMSEAENLYFFSLIQNFENAKELNEGQDALGMLQSLGQGKAESDPTQETMMKLMTGQNPTYSLKKKEFRISRPASDMSQMSEEEKESMQMMQMFMGAIEYEYVIHFPKKVKKVNLKEAEIVDGNTVRIKAPMPKMGEKNEPFELIVKFK
ncbi:MAG: hypothetical protein KDD02_16850 [Phaeodactylibacter sp.]|nr:hypothetical protein [Phaeodactylibacter sp.]MCB9299774.1 hypothetical protein [Lewinellaceae bacterium]HQU60576.1 hypothetical protein [Saprospiraceae bacterium]